MAPAFALGSRNVAFACLVKWFLKALEAGAFASATAAAAGEGRSAPRGAATWRNRGCGGFGCVHIGLFLRLADVLLVPDSLVAEPVAHLNQIISVVDNVVDMR